MLSQHDDSSRLKNTQQNTQREMHASYVIKII